MCTAPDRLLSLYLFLTAWVIMVVSCFALLILFLGHLKSTGSLPPQNSIGYLFYVVAFSEEGFNASYLKIKHCATPESFTGCPCPRAILLALPVWLSWITCPYSRYQLEIICQPDSLLLHFISFCSSLYFFPSTVLGFIGSSSTFKDGNVNYWFHRFFSF